MKHAYHFCAPLPHCFGWLASLFLLITNSLLAQEYAYQYQISAEAQGLTQFNYPYGVAVDGLNNVYVADQNNHRIQKFNANGQLLFKFGTNGYGNGQFTYPSGVAIDGSGAIYVADQANHRIQKFDANGQFILKFGTQGTGDGQLSSPYGLAIDGSGAIYVADQANDRIQKFSASGQFIGKFGTPGSSDGQLNKPTGVAVDASGNVYVADRSNNRIQKFDANGQFLLKFGTQGSGNGQFINPAGVAIDGSGNVYVADQFGQRIQKFSSLGAFLAKFGSFGSGDGQFNYPTGVALNGTGDIYVADQRNNRIQKFNASGQFLLKFGTQGVADGELNKPTGVAIDGSGAIYVADQANDRIQKFDADGQFLLKFGTRGTANGQFQNPTAIAVNGSGTIYVADETNSRIQKFNASGQFLGTFGSLGRDDGQLFYPVGIALDASGNVYVTDKENYRIQKFSASGEFILKFGTQGTGNGQFNSPYGVAIDGSGNIYVADQANHRIQKFSASGQFLTKFGTFGSGDGQFNYPTGVDVDGNGNLYVTDQFNHRIQKFSANGEFLAKFGTQGSGNGQFNSPYGVTLDGSGNVYAADRSNNRIQVFAPVSTPEITLTLNGTPIADGNGAVAFGNTFPGTPVPKTFTVSNTGSAALTLSGLMLPTGFVLEGDFPASVAAGGTATFAITLLAAEVGNYAGQLSFTTNDADENPFNIFLSGAVLVPAPLVASFSPGNGSVGQPVVLTGTAFTGATQVNFNGTPAPFNVNSATQITATVPLMATTGPIAVTTPGGTASSATYFVVQQVPVVTWPAPAAFTYGTPLSAAQLNATASSKGIPVSGTFIYSPLAETVLPAGEHTLRVDFVPDDQAAYTSVAGITVQITVDKATPVITWPAPAAVSQGTPLSAAQLNATAAFNGSTVAGAFAYTPGAGSVLAAGQQTLSVDFTPTDGDNYKAVNGTTVNLTVNAPLNSAPLLTAIGNKTVNEGSLLTFQATAEDDLNQTLVYSLVGTVPDGATISGAGAFSWMPSEAQGPGNYTFTVRVTDDGAGNLADEEEITVTVNEANAAPVLAFIGNRNVDAGSLLTFTVTATDSDLPSNTLSYRLAGTQNGPVPAGAGIDPVTGVFAWTPTQAQGLGSYALTVVVSDGSATDEEIITVTVNKLAQLPVISGFTPASGPAGTQVTISGSNLLQATAVRFNGITAASFTANPTNGTVSAVVPAGARTGPIQVVAPDGTATSSTNFNVTLPVPVIAGFAPASGPVGTLVTITGNHLSGTTRVQFGNTQAIEFSVVNPTTLTARVPTGAKTGSISLATPGGTARSTSSFVVTVAAGSPTIGSFKPSRGPVGTLVTITGGNFTQVTSVRFNTITVGLPGFTIENNGTVIKVAVPAGAITGSITVTTAEGLGATSKQTFRVTAPSARLSTESLAAPFAVSASPNPFSQLFTLHVAGEWEGKLPVVVYNLHGREVLRLEDVQGAETKHLGNELLPGMYMLVVGEGNKTRRFKLVKIQ